MHDLETLATFLGWCTVLNIVVVILMHIVIGILRDFIGEVAEGIFGVTQEQTNVTLLRVVAQYRIAIAMFNLVPYIALKIMLV